MSRLITLTTDFGTESTYVAAMKGAIWQVAPEARIVDLSHSIPPQNIIAAGLFVRDTLPYFPSDCIHVIVVDPGVGTDRAILLIEWRGSYILAPDNGCWTTVIQNNDVTVRKLEFATEFGKNISNTFHGRDVFAPAAGHLWNGRTPSNDVLNKWNSLELPTAIQTDDRTEGEVLTIDSFGNLITNIPARCVGDNQIVSIEGHPIGKLSRSYGDHETGLLIALISSNGHLEIAEVNGSAANRLGLRIGAKVTLGPA